MTAELFNLHRDACNAADEAMGYLDGIEHARSNVRLFGLRGAVVRATRVTTIRAPGQTQARLTGLLHGESDALLLVVSDPANDYYREEK